MHTANNPVIHLTPPAHSSSNPDQLSDLVERSMFTFKAQLDPKSTSNNNTKEFDFDACAEALSSKAKEPLFEVNILET